jgi:hypothetical protein
MHGGGTMPSRPSEFLPYQQESFGTKPNLPPKLKFIRATK